MGELGTLAGRYELIRLIGRGASADVFEAVDLRLGSTVALKRFRDASADGLLRLKTEFRQLAEVHEPGLVRLYDLVVDGTLGFFTMELVDGVSIAEHARTGPRDATLAALVEVVHAVAGLHRSGQLHRDLKPGNVLVGTGRVRVLDFGLSGRLGGPSAGTLAYMAPELVGGLSAGPASDWYALGTLMYEVFTGRLPATGPVAEALLRKKQRRFPRPGALATDLSPELDALIWALLAPDAADRPDASAILAALGAVGRRVEPAALFGRDAEISWLRTCADVAKPGSVAVFIEAESGIGKTRLVRSFLETAEMRSRLVLTSAARPQESVPMRAIDAVVDQLVEAVREASPDTRRELLTGIPSSLAHTFPVFGVFQLGPPKPEAGIDVLAARQEAHAAFVELLARVSTRRPTALWIDDLQWADEESLLLLEQVVAHGCAGLLLIFSSRPAHHPHWMSTLERRSLGPLDERASRQLVTSHARDATLSHDSISHVLAAAAGNPFLLEFFARNVDRDYDLAASFASVVRTLPTDARELFECIALTTRPLPLDCVGKVLRDRARLRDHVAHLAQKGLVAVGDGDQISAHHETIRDLAARSFDEGTRRARHDALATVLAGSSLPREWQIPHLEGAGRGAAAGDIALLAAREASKRYAFEVAAAYYDKALALAPLSQEERATTLEELANNLASMGRGREASERYRDAAAGYGEVARTDTALTMRQRGAIALLRAGAIAEGRASLAHVLESMGERIPRSPMLAAIVELLRLGFTRRDRRNETIAAKTRMKLETLWTSATSLSMYDPMVANALTLRFVRQALAAGEPRWVLRARALEAAFLAALGGRNRKRAQRRMTELRELAIADAGAYEAAWVAATEGSTAWLSGDIRSCLDWTLRARDMFQRVPETSAYELALLDSFRIPAMTVVGAHATARGAAAEAIAVAETRGDNFAMLPCLHGHITMAHLAANEPDRGARHADRAREITAHSNSPMPTYHQAWSRATLALFAGDGRGAHDGLRAMWPKLRSSGMLRLEAVAGDMRYLRGRCAIAARLGDDARAQMRWLRRSTLASGGAAADSLEAQLVALAGGDPTAHAQRAERGFDALGLETERDAFRRWQSGQPSEQLDRVAIPVR